MALVPRHVLALACVAVLGPGCGEDVNPATTPDAGNDAGADASPCTEPDCADAGPEPIEGPARYPLDRTQSPVTPFVAARLRASLGAGAAVNVFAKVGDSLTVDADFLRCFAGDQVDLAGRDELSPTLEHFLAGDAGGTSPFERDSLAAGVGWSAGAALDGDPSPLARELDAIDPGFALVLFGTNDVGTNDPVAYGEHMFDIVDGLLRRGVIPILSSMPPRDDDLDVDVQVPLFNAVARGLAQGRQVPFIDLERELRALPGHGLAGDGVHPDVYVNGGPRACAFTRAGLEHGFNWRNLLALESLHRVEQVVLDGVPAPDAPEPLRAGDGTAAAPFPIDAATWSDLASTLDAPSDSLAQYTGCAAGQDESGPEVVYALTLDQPTHLDALVIDGEDADIDLHLLGGAVREDACLARNDRHISMALEAGVYFLVLDTYVPADGRSRAGEFLLVVRVTPL